MRLQRTDSLWNAAVFSQHSRDAAYVRDAGVQAGLLSACSDAVSQAMHGMAHVDMAHVAAMALLACLLSGMANAVWMRFLEKSFPGGTLRAVSLKTLVDYGCCATSFNAFFLVGIPWLTAVFAALASDGLSPAPASLLEHWSVEDWHALMRLEACTFVPYNLLAFRLVPVHLRPLGSASLSAVCTVVLSGVTLGFG